MNTTPIDPIKYTKWLGVLGAPRIPNSLVSPIV